MDHVEANIKSILCLLAVLCARKLLCEILSVVDCLSKRYSSDLIIAKQERTCSLCFDMTLFILKGEVAMVLCQTMV